MLFVPKPYVWSYTVSKPYIGPQDRIYCLIQSYILGLQPRINRNQWVKQIWKWLYDSTFLTLMLIDIGVKPGKQASKCCLKMKSSQTTKSEIVWSGRFSVGQIAGYIFIAQHLSSQIHSLSFKYLSFSLLHTLSLSHTHTNTHTHTIRCSTISSLSLSLSFLYNKTCLKKGSKPAKLDPF